MDNMMIKLMDNNNNKETNIGHIKKMIIWSFCMIYNYDHRHRQIVFGYRIHFIFLVSVLVTLYFLPVWLYEVVYNISLYEHLVNMTACWNATENNATLMSNELHSGMDLHSNLKWHFLCFAKSKLFESSEHKMLLLLLCCCTLQSSSREALWKQMLNFKKINESEFYTDIWKYIKLYFKNLDADEFDTSVQATSSTFVDNSNQLCICKPDYVLPGDSKSYLLLPPTKSSARFSTPSDKITNLDATVKDAVPVNEHFHSNINQTGYIAYSADLESFLGTFQYPLPKKKAEADRIGQCRNGIVFTMYHASREFAVKKAIYRQEEIEVYSQLHHPNITNLVAVLIGKEHKHHKDRHYAYQFMPKMGVNLKNVLSISGYGCLKCLKTNVNEKDFALALRNVNYILKSILKALLYMNSQGIVHNNVKPSNVMIKMVCRCGDINVLLCACCRQAFAVKLIGFSSSKASYNCLYASEIDNQLFGHLVLDIFVGKSKQRSEGSEDIYHLQFSELERFFGDVPELCDLVQKCFQVTPNYKATAEDLLQSNFFN